jgi:xanthine/CO dehydrogenase XdhC/CoxF family maturation factor
MTRWAETSEVLERLSLWNEEGKRAALATVVSVSGSAYRSSGAKLLVASDGSTWGNVSGGCLEEDVREVALRVIESGRPQLRTYCTGAGEVEAWDLGVGCEGVVEVFVAPAPNAEEVRRERSLLEGEDPFVIVTSLEGGATGVDSAGELRRMIVFSSGGIKGELGRPELTAAVSSLGHEIFEAGAPHRRTVLGHPLFFDLFVPPPRLLIVGAGKDARPLSELAVRVGFRVTVADRRPGKLSSALFPAKAQLLRTEPRDLPWALPLDEESRVVIMTHNYAEDLAALRALIGTATGYNGVLGPRARTERLLAAVLAERPAEVSRVHGPVGLDIGGEGAEAVALAILAEILTLRPERTGLVAEARGASPHVAVE